MANDERSTLRDAEQQSIWWKRYEDGLSYQRKLKLDKKVAKCIRFYEGDQWPPISKRTRNFPRPVTNQVKMICRNKKSGILSAPVRLVYRADTPDTAALERFNQFAAYIQKEMGQELLDKQAVHNAVIGGSYVYHYYWDADARGKNATVDGGVRGECIDVLNIFFADPTERDEQKQEWILIASREKVSSVRAKADKGVDPALIVADDAEANPYDTKEQDDEKLCTVLTAYFRQDGEVYCTKAVRSTLVNAPFALAPDVHAVMLEDDEAKQQTSVAADEDEAADVTPQNNDLPDRPGTDSPVVRARAPLYPIVMGSYEFRNGSIYGIGEVENLIPNQEAINHTLAMLMYNLQQTAWSKYVVKEDALRGQVITDEPGQVLTDHSKTGNGIDFLKPAPTPASAANLVDMLVQLTRSVSGSSEIMTGETLKSGMSGAAIAQLQSQAQQPVEELREAFWLVKEKQGKVLAQFFKLYYEGAEFVPLADESAPAMPSGAAEAAMQSTAPMQGTGMADPRQVQIFNGSQYSDVEFEVVVEATGSTKYSAAGDINVLEVLYGKGAISLETFIRSYPDDALSNKSKLLEGIESEKNGQLQQLTGELQATQQKLMEATSLIEQQRQTVDQVVSVISENNKLKSLLAAVYKEAEQKLAMANEQIRAGNHRILQSEQAAREAAADATEFAEHIYKNEMGGVAPHGMPQMQNGAPAAGPGRYGSGHVPQPPMPTV